MSRVNVISRGLLAVLFWCLAAGGVCADGVPKTEPLGWPREDGRTEYIIDFAAKMVATISNDPACAKFKDEIMFYTKSRQYDGQALGWILAIKKKAVLVGCAE